MDRESHVVDNERINNKTIKISIINLVSESKREPLVFAGIFFIERVLRRAIHALQTNIFIPIKKMSNIGRICGKISRILYLVRNRIVQWLRHLAH